MPAPKVRSKDSIQQRLRDHKREWNSTYKDFSQKLKAFKDGLNGRGNAKVGLPPSNIKEPFPGEVGAYLNQLAGEFQSLVGDATSIMSEQEQYARTRRRRRPKAPSETKPAEPTAPVPAAPVEEKAVEQQLARLGISQSDLDKFATSKLSRFWQYFTAMFSSKQFNKQRVGLLRQGADMYYALLDFEEEALSMSISKIPQMASSYIKFQSTAETFNETFEGVLDLVRQVSGEEPPVSEVDNKMHNDQHGIDHPKYKKPDAKPEEVEKPSEAPIQVAPDIAQIEKDKHLLFNAGLAKNQIIHLNKMINQYKQETDEHTKALLASRLKDFHHEIVSKLAQEVQKRYGPANIRSIQDIVNLVRKNSNNETVSQYMVKNASGVSRFLKKKLLRLAPGSKAATVRLEISSIIDDMKSAITKIMDALENVQIEGEASLQEVLALMGILKESSSKLQRPLHILNRYYMIKFYERAQKEKKKGRSPEMTEEDVMMDAVLKRKLKRELARGMT